MAKPLFTLSSSLSSQNESQLISAFRRKYITTLMILVGMVLGVVFIMIVGITYQSEKRDIDVSINHAFKNPSSRGSLATIGSGHGASKPSGIGPTFKTGSSPQNVSNKIIPVFVAHADLDGSNIYAESRYVDMDESTRDEAVAAALATPSYSGYLGDFHLFYAIEEMPSGYHIAFVDSQSLESSLKALIITSLITIVISLIAFFFIALWLSKLAVHPIEEAWNAQKRFIADASHELKTPLTVILANTNILLSNLHETIESQKEWLQNTREEAIAMQNLVQDLLVLSRLQSQSAQSPDQLHRTRETLNFSDIVRKTVLQFEGVAFETGVSLAEQIEKDLMVDGSASELERLLKILLDNACKYVNRSGAIQVNLKSLGTTCVVSVNNTGTPIPPEDLNNIFKRFYRSDTSRDRQSGGYGLGLAIASSIVNNHAGIIRAASNEEQGTTFYVELPLHKEEVVSES